MLASTDKRSLVTTMKHENEGNIYYGNDLEDKGRNSLNRSLAMVLILLLIIKHGSPGAAGQKEDADDLLNRQESTVGRERSGEREEGRGGMGGGGKGEGRGERAQTFSLTA